MSGKAAKIVLTERQKMLLENIIRSRMAPQRLIQRGQVILLATGGMRNFEISLQIGIGRQQVGLCPLWRRRWQQSQPALLTMELNETQAELRRTIEDVLSDAPRSGLPGKFTAEEVIEIIAVACEDPKGSKSSGQSINGINDQSPDLLFLERSQQLPQCRAIQCFARPACFSSGNSESRLQNSTPSY